MGFKGLNGFYQRKGGQPSFYLSLSHYGFLMRQTPVRPRFARKIVRNIQNMPFGIGDLPYFLQNMPFDIYTNWFSVHRISL